MIFELFAVLMLMILALLVSNLVSGSFTGSMTLDGVTSSYNTAITGEAGVKANPSPLVGQAGTLSTRASGTAGTLTLATGHGVTTGSTIGLYWTNADGTDGKAYIATVGTVSGLSVPFTGATGDALPVVDYAIVAGKINEAVFSVVGDNIVAIQLSTEISSGYAVVSDGSGILLSAYITPSAPYQWFLASGIDNPLAGETATKVNFSQKGVLAAATDMKATAIVA